MSTEASNGSTKTGPFQVLIVEDNSPDVVLITEALSEAGLACNVTQFKDGDEAVQRLLGSNSKSENYDLFILDLNMPRVGGMEVLTRIRAVPLWKGTPILVLTSSLSPEEREQATQLGADAYVRKAADLYEFLSSVGEAAKNLLCPPQ
jgi:CheY-like chemotaxis protein